MHNNNNGERNDRELPPATTMRSVMSEKYMCDYCSQHVTEAHRCKVPREMGWQMGEMVVQMLLEKERRRSHTPYDNNEKEYQA